MFDLFNPTIFVVLVESILFGVTMKIADLLDEHGLEWFTGSAILFGLLWGSFGSLLMLGNDYLAIFLAVLLIHWILRYRIDYLNHGIAASIMLITLLYIFPSIAFDWFFFLFIFLSFSVHGLLNDASDRGEIKGIVSKYFKSNIHWVWVPLISVFIFPANYLVFWVSTLFIISYEATSKLGLKIIEKQN